VYFVYVGLSSHTQNTTVTGAGGGSDEEKTDDGGDMDFYDCHELRYAYFDMTAQ
jgi:hypothetical protein